jgi:ABC-2 type transport system permease protein
MSALRERPAAAVTERRPSLPRLLGDQTAYALRSFVRSPIAAFFSLVFPLLFLVLIGALAGNEVIDPTTGLRLAQFLMPAMAVFGTAMASFSTLAIAVAADREAGVLKRLRGSPVPLAVYVAGRVIGTGVAALVSFALLLAVGITAYGVQIVWGKAPAALLTLALGIVCLAALGMAVAAVVRRAEAVGAVTNGLLVPLAFISGVFSMGTELPDWLERFAALFPLRHLLEALTETFNPYTAGAGFDWSALGVLVLWTVVGAAVAVRWFRWDAPAAGEAGRRRRRPGGRSESGVPAPAGRIEAVPPEQVGRPAMARLLAAQLQHANRMLWRNRTAIFFSLAFPAILVLVIPQVFGTGTIPDRGVELPQFLTPVMGVYGMAAGAYMGLCELVASARERRVLTRINGTPLPVWAYVGGLVGAAVLLALVTMVLVVVVGVAAYGIVVVWSKLPALLVYLALGVACFAALGLAVAALVAGERAASAVANATLLPLAFVSDIFIIGGLPPLLDAIGWVFPLKHLANGVADTFNPTLPGAGLDAGHVLVLAAWAVGAGIIAWAAFRRQASRAG